MGAFFDEKLAFLTNLSQFALVDAVRNDGLGGVIARLELRPLCFLRRVGLPLPDFDVLVARDGLLPFGLLLVCRADLDKLRLGGNLGFYVRVQFGCIAIRVGELCGIWANCKSFLLALRRRDNRVRIEPCRLLVQTTAQMNLLVGIGDCQNR
jgi:hypothetical protein